MRSLYLLLFFCVLHANHGFAQTDSSHLFENTKGLLDPPLTKYLRIEKNDPASGAARSITFITDSSYAVKAIFDGYILSIDLIDEAYGLIAKYGDYFIVYSGLTIPELKAGDSIKRGQTISTVAKYDENTFRLDINLLHNDEYIDPYPWFKKGT